MVVAVLLVLVSEDERVESPSPSTRKSHRFRAVKKTLRASLLGLTGGCLPGKHLVCGCGDDGCSAAACFSFSELVNNTLDSQSYLLHRLLLSHCPL